jgi:4,5-dihydroxyphthalate decarboxylase
MAGGIENPTGVDKVHQRVAEIIGDPLPYGVEPNRKVLEDLIQHALTQKIITKPVSVDELFAPATRALVG